MGSDISSVKASPESYILKNRLRVARAERDISQEELAKLAGVTRQTINAIELGKYSPSLEVAFRIAVAFGVRLEDVFTYDGGPQDSPREPR